MNAVLTDRSAHAVAIGTAHGRPIAVPAPRTPAVPAIAMVLLGTGVVGGALLKLLNTPAAASIGLVGAANSRRQQTEPAVLADRHLRERLKADGAPRHNPALLAALDASGAPIKVMVDATASALLAAYHADWLACGYHVVSANKAAAGGELPTWRALQAVLGTGARYGDAATVGAGLPVLSTLRRLRSCGDRLLALEGVLSGSLSYLFTHFDGSRPFSGLLREAHALGYTEPDPRSDLSGQDVARKLLILARLAGFALGSDEVDVQSLVPESLRTLTTAAFLDRLADGPLEELDAPLAARHAQASSRGNVLRFLARLDRHGNARAGLVEVDAAHPAARLGGTDNLFALTTACYRRRPLVIQGPGAGPQVTAQALLADVLGLG